MKNLRWLLESGVADLARIPTKNAYLLHGSDLMLERLEQLKAYTIPVAGHDYAAKTPIMWNTVYEKLNLPLCNIMLIASPERLSEVLGAFREDARYLGGGIGVGLKEKVIPYLDRVVPNDLKSVNCIVKEGKELVGYNTDAWGFVQSLDEKLGEFHKQVKGSNIVVFGAGGVAKEVCRQLAILGASYVAIINRTRQKAVSLAHELGSVYEHTEFIGVGEDLIRGVCCNTIKTPNAMINLTDKGSDGLLVDQCAFAPSGEYNRKMALDDLRHIKALAPNAIIADITLPQGAWPITLQLAETAGFEKRQLLNGIPMVINQAGPAYIKIQQAHPDLHSKKLSQTQVLQIMRDSV
ncbi:MAG: hypothetical protein AABX52_00385 [Nanoarchaeota archaeon]